MLSWVGACGKILGADFDGARVASAGGAAGDAAPGGGGGAPGGGGGATGGGGTATGGSGGLGGSSGTGASGGTDAGACAVIYVSTLGDDLNTGCAQELPKRTISGALAVAHAEKSVETIRICAGTYDEAVTLDIPVDLHGSYDCKTWARTSDYGYPTFDAKNETIVGGSKVPEALRVTGAAVTGAASLDGLTVLGAKIPSSGDGGAVTANASALRVDANAAPTVSNCTITGGSTVSVSTDGSIGLRVEAGAAPEVFLNRIEGGTGITYDVTRVGRVGVLIAGAAPSLHDNVIRGGSGTPPSSLGIGSVGLVVRDSSALTLKASKAVRKNSIGGGDSASNTPGVSSAGVLLTGKSEVDFVENTIRPGASLGSAVELRGVESRSAGPIGLYQNRIFGGDLSHPSAPWEGFRVAVWVEGAQGFFAENNLIYGGVPVLGFTGGSPSFALSLTDVSNAVVQHNTLYSGPSGFPTVGTALKVFAGVSSAVVQNNILMAESGWTEPVYIEPCASKGVFARFQNNLLLNTGISPAGDIANLYGYGFPASPPCQEWQGFESIAALESHMKAVCSSATPGPCAAFGGVKASGNLSLKANCAGDSGCKTWSACAGDSMPCLKSIFAEWSSAQLGLDTMFGPGWKLAAGVPCAIAKSSVDAAVLVDFAGSPRTSPPSMGAAEHDGACTP